MYRDCNLRNVLAGPAEAARRVEDVLPEGAEPGFARRFLPEAPARTLSIAS